MPFFKSTYNILKKPDEDEVFDPNWMDSDTLVLPPKREWDYSRELHVEDVDVWEVLTETSGGFGVYVSWDPYAEFYLVTTGFDFIKLPYTISKQTYTSKIYETYYGPGAQQKVRKKAKELGLLLKNVSIWVEEKDMWLYQEEQVENTIFTVL